jgi:hypothetical protein
MTKASAIRGFPSYTRSMGVDLHRDYRACRRYPTPHGTIMRRRNGGANAAVATLRIFASFLETTATMFGECSSVSRAPTCVRTLTATCGS